MKKIDEIFTPELQKALRGIYILDCFNTPVGPLFPAEEPLTLEQFGFISGNVIFTADDLQWNSTCVDDKDFRYGDKPNQYLSRLSLPNQICYLLDTFICIRLATQQLSNLKSSLDSIIIDTERKASILNACCAFDKATDDKTKLRNAHKALSISIDSLKSIKKLEHLANFDTYIIYEMDTLSDYIATLLSEK